MERSGKMLNYKDILVLINYIKIKGGTISVSEVIIATRKGGCLYNSLENPPSVLGAAMKCNLVQKSGANLILK